MSTDTKRVVTVYTEASPNPESLKFVINFVLLENMSVDYPSAKDAENSPLVKTLFAEFSFIQRIFVASNFLTITKDSSTDWFQVQSNIRLFIKDYLMAEKPVFNESIKELVQIKEQEEKIKESNNPETEIEAKIKTVLEDYVRPAVEKDGGAISFKKFVNGVVTVELQGACSGCPSATITLKDGIENLLKRMVPEVTDVVADMGK